MSDYNLSEEQLQNIINKVYQKGKNDLANEQMNNQIQADDGANKRSVMGVSSGDDVLNEWRRIQAVVEGEMQ